MPAASKRRVLFEWLFAGGALLAVVTGSADIYAATIANAHSQKIEICKRAYEALLDDRLNEVLTGSERQSFKNQQLQIAAKCARSAWP